MSKTKSVGRTADRIIEIVESGNYDPETIHHMLDSLVLSYKKRIKELEKSSRPRKFVLTEKEVSGALRSCIHDHGPITVDFVGSAAKRIYRGCQRLIEARDD